MHRSTTTASSAIRLPILPGDIERLERLVVARGARLVIVDVLSAYLDAKVNSLPGPGCPLALHPLAMMAARTGAIVLVLRHLNKSGGVNALYRGGRDRSGSPAPPAPCSWSASTPTTTHAAFSPWSSRTWRRNPVAALPAGARRRLRLRPRAMGGHQRTGADDLVAACRPGGTGPPRATPRGSCRPSRRRPGRVVRDVQRGQRGRDREADPRAGQGETRRVGRPRRVPRAVAVESPHIHSPPLFAIPRYGGHWRTVGKRPARRPRRGVLMVAGRLALGSWTLTTALPPPVPRARWHPTRRVGGSTPYGGRLMLSPIGCSLRSSTSDRSAADLIEREASVTDPTTATPRLADLGEIGTEIGTLALVATYFASPSAMVAAARRYAAPPPHPWAPLNRPARADPSPPPAVLYRESRRLLVACDTGLRRRRSLLRPVGDGPCRSASSAPCPPLAPRRRRGRHS